MAVDTETERLSASSRPPVGVPIQEAVLHSALKEHHRKLFPPGVGRSTFFLSEPELGFGRPDALILTVSKSALSAFRRTGLRLPSLSAAKSLAGVGSGNSERYDRALARDLSRSGWTAADLIAAGKIIHDSIAVEAKLNEWRRAIRQASTYRIGAGRAAVLLPDRVSTNVDLRNLEAHEVGLLLSKNGKITWSVAAQPGPLSPSHRAWLLELLLRDLDSGILHTTKSHP